MDRSNDITFFKNILWYNSRDLHLYQVAFESRDIGIFPLVTRGEIDCARPQDKPDHNHTTIVPSLEINVCFLDASRGIYGNNT